MSIDSAGWWRQRRRSRAGRSGGILLIGGRVCVVPVGLLDGVNLNGRARVWAFAKWRVYLWFWTARVDVDRRVELRRKHLHRNMIGIGRGFDISPLLLVFLPLGLRGTLGGRSRVHSVQQPRPDAVLLGHLFALVL